MLPAFLSCAIAKPYKNFNVSIYTPAAGVRNMANRTWLETSWKLINDQISIDRIFIETHRDGKAANESVIEDVKSFFKGKGIEVSGGITFTMPGYTADPDFSTFCFSDPGDRGRAKAISELTARHYDTIILDDFFFTSCKTDIEISAKGDRTWTAYRREIMADAAKNLVHGPAHAVNPNVKVIIKFPNWYDHFPGLGFDLSTEPQIFDGIWTGTETRNPWSDQHLQAYLGYGIVRYFENVAPGKNGGGWVDTWGNETGADRYAEQLWLTLFAKAKEITLFEYEFMRNVVVNASYHRTPWQGKEFEGQYPSFNFTAAMAPYRNEAGELVVPTTFARIASWALEKVDPIIGKLGKPIGIKSYKPLNSRGDDFLQTYLGMIGLPIEMVPSYPVEAKVVILTAQAADDADLVRKIESTLKAGGNVFVTSGLIAVARDRIADIVELGVTSTVFVNSYGTRGKGSATSKDILVRQVWFNTNDAWAIISGGHPLPGGTFGVPILLRAPYSKGNLWVMTIPEDFGDLYAYPPAVLDSFRSRSSTELGIYITGPSKVSLFLYDNSYLILENFNDFGVKVAVHFDRASDLIEDGKGDSFWGVKIQELALAPHQFRVFRATLA
jgi:hypothetical protein